MALDFLKTVIGRGRKAEDKRAVPAGSSGLSYGQGMEASGKTKLEVKDVSGWISSEMKGEIERERKEFSSVTNGLIALINDLRRIMENMEKKSFEAGDRTYAAVNMIKDTWVKKSLVSLSSYEREVQKDMLSPAKIDFHAFSIVHEKTEKLLNEMSMDQKQKIVVGKYFESESKKMVEVLRSVRTVMKEMKDAMERDGALKGIYKLENLLKRISAGKEETKNASGKIESIKTSMDEKQDEIEKTRLEVTGFEKSPEWKELETIEKGLEERAQRKEDIENEISETLGGMKRVFKLFAHDASEIGKDERKLVLDMSHSPLKAFISNDSRSIGSVLKMMEHDIENGSFRLSEKDKGKTALLKKLTGSGRLEEAKETHDKLRKEMEDLKKKREGIKVISQKEEKKRMLEKLESEFSMLEEEKKVMEKELERNAEDLEAGRKEISDFLKRGFGRDVEIL